MPKFVFQSLSTRYVDTEILEKELNRILGKDGWGEVRMVAGQLTFSVIRLLTEAELDEILLKMRQRYASQREEANWDA